MFYAANSDKLQRLIIIIIIIIKVLVSKDFLLE